MSSLGLSEYMPKGLIEWSPFIGAAAASGGVILVKKYAKSDSWFAANPEISGWIFSSIVAGAFYLSPSTRSAAIPAFLGGTAAALPKIIAKKAGMLTGISGLGYYQAETANPLLGMVQADQLGYATASNVAPAYGTVPGVAGAGAIAGPIADDGYGAPVNLLGAPSSHMNLARHYGATHMG